MNQPKSAYTLHKNNEKEKRHIFFLIVDNLPGILARIVNMFSARGYNIDSLTTSPINRDNTISRITIVSTGTPNIISKVNARLQSIVAVRHAYNISADEHVEREVALLKINVCKENRLEALRLAESFKAEIVDSSLEIFTFMIVGKAKKITQFVNLQREIGSIELVRSGVIAISSDDKIINHSLDL